MLLKLITYYTKKRNKLNSKAKKVTNVQRKYILTHIIKLQLRAVRLITLLATLKSNKSVV